MLADIVWDMQTLSVAGGVAFMIVIVVARS
jgi:hypothetical protein